MTTYYAKIGQIKCYNCGASFAIANPDDDGTRETIATCCPNGCNRGSWVSRTQNDIFCVPIEYLENGCERSNWDATRDWGENK